MNSFSKINRNIFLFLSVLGTLSCGRGVNPLASKTDSKVSISVFGAKGTISGATVKMYSLDESGNRTSELGSCSLDDSNCKMTSSPQSSAVEFSLSGGTYIDEATRTSIPMGTFTMRTRLATIIPDTILMLSALTEMAVRYCEQQTGSIAERIARANSHVASTFNLSTITSVSSNPVVATKNPSSNDAKYGLALSALSQYAKDVGAETTEVVKSFASDYGANGKISGTVSIPLKAGGTVATNMATYSSAVANFISNPKNPGFTSESNPLNSNARLSNLAISIGTLSPAFASDVTSYSASVTNSDSSIDVTARTLASESKIKINGTVVTSGTPKNVNLNTGANTISVVVISKDETATQTYSITVTRPDVCENEASSTFDSGNGSSGTPYLISKASQMQFLGSCSAIWNKNFKVTADFSLSSYSNATFNIIGKESAQFTGQFDGQNHTISGFTHSGGNSTNHRQIALFGAVGGQGVVKNLKLTNVNITDGFYHVAALVGKNEGTITNCSASGSISFTDTNGSSVYVGGLVSENLGTISGSSSNVNISTTNGGTVGGFVSRNNGSNSRIENSFSTGSVSDTNTLSYAAGKVGGFVGENSKSITTSYSTGSVSSTAGSMIAGFAAENSGFISKSYSTGSITAINAAAYGIGGFAGESSGYLFNSYSTGNISLTCSNQKCTLLQLGGFAGHQNGGAIDQSYSTGNISATGLTSGPAAGGFVGRTESGNITNSYSLSGIDLRAESANTGINVGGFAGDYGRNVAYSYSAGTITTTNLQTSKVRGFLGESSSSSIVTSTFWDTTTSGIATSSTGSRVSSTGYSTSLMKTASTFSGAWNSVIWNLQNGSYPTLIRTPSTGTNTSPSTLYFCNKGSGLWSDTSNWFNDSACTIGSLREPKADESVVIQGGLFTDKVSSRQLFSYTGAAPTDPSLTSEILIQQGGELSVSSGHWGGSTQGPNTTVTFSGTAYNDGKITGDATFNGNSINHGSVAGTITWGSSNTYNASTCRSRAGSMFSGGNGSSSTPYLISTASQMHFLGACEDLWRYYFKMTADIDLSSYPNSDLNIIGNSLAGQFAGTFDGDGHTISNFTRSLGNSSYDDKLGLFGSIGSSGVIKNLTLTGVSINQVPSMLGGLAGFNQGTITNCSVAGSITANASSSNPTVGGVVGQNEGTINSSTSTVTLNLTNAEAAGLLVGLNQRTIQNSSSNGTLNSSGGSRIGGLVGRTSNGSSITECSSAGSIVINNSTGNGLGGFVGESQGTILKSKSTVALSISCSNSGSCGGARLGNFLGYQSGGSIDQSYANGSISATGIDNCYVGGFVGRVDSGTTNDSFAKASVTVVGSSGSSSNRIGGFAGGGGNPSMSSVYSTGAVSASTTNMTLVGGFFGEVSGGSLTRAYWDTTTSGLSTSGSAGGAVPVGYATATMKNSATYTGWDTAIWSFPAGAYPSLISNP